MWKFSLAIMQDFYSKFKKNSPGTAIPDNSTEAKPGCRPFSRMGLFIGRLVLAYLVMCLYQGGQARGSAVQFVDVTVDWGIHFVQQNGMSSEKMLPETTGSGAALFDHDGDDDLDLYLVNSGHMTKGRGDALNRLYRNDGARFVDVTAAANVPGRAYGMGVAAADYDNDGDTDLYLTNLGDDVLYRNDGGYFAEVSGEAGLGNPLWSSSAAFVDYDNDGDLDLCVANYVEFDIATHPWCGIRDMDLRFYCDPLEYPPTRDLLYRNNGDGSFAEMGEAAGIVRAGNGLGLVAADLDEDGDQDLYIANDKTPNFFYENQGGGSFEEIGLTSGTALSANGAAQAGMGVDAGDLDNDGDLDLFVTNYQLENNALYRNDGLYFSEVSFQAGLGEASLNYLGFGTGFFDYDNDGWLDLFVANGHVHDNIEDYDELATYAQQAQIFHNEGGGRYVERTRDLGPGLKVNYVGRGAAFGDCDGDGDLDIVLVNSGGPAAVLRNDGGNANNWLQVELEGRESNRDGIGAKIYLRAGALRLSRQVKSGSGFLSTSQKAPFFGLGIYDKVERLEVRWPSGRVQVLENVRANQVIFLVEPMAP